MNFSDLDLSAEHKEKLKIYLDRLYSEFDRKYLPTSALNAVHKFAEREDIEVMGLVAACLAYGRVKGILSSLDRIAEAMEWEPYEFALKFEPKRDAKKFKGFAHRFTTGDDVACLIHYISQILRRWGSIERFFLRYYNPGDDDVGPSLARFSDGALSLDSSPFYGASRLPRDAGVRFFFPSPSTGSACKRLNLYLRWMARPADGIDFGLWRAPEPSKLVIPLDTHVARIAKRIGLTRLKSPGWAMAADITRTLKEFDPVDPVKYDFALCRLGVISQCPKAPSQENCAECPMKGICAFFASPGCYL